MKVLTLPFSGFLVMSIFSLCLLEGGRMIVPSTMDAYRRNKLMKHFVKNHTLDKITWHKRLIEAPVNTNDLLSAIIDAETD
jgi:hypothetical protein